MVCTPIQVRFNDMDPMRRVNNASYASYLELGRLAFCNRHLAIQTLEDIPFVLVRVEMDIRRPLGPGMQAEVCTWVSRIGRSSWDFSAEIRAPEGGAVFAQARTVQVYFDYRADTVRAIPEDFRAMLAGAGRPDHS